ncbi:MAG: hypothetical protein ABGW87_13130 [Sphingomonadaceae bacterium]
MIIQDIERPASGEPLLLPVSQQVQRREGNFLYASGLIGNTPPEELAGALATGFIPIQTAGVGIAATVCDRPLVFHECELLAQAFAMDLLLMRFDPLSGVSFDILFKGEEEWLCHYLAWRRPMMDIWLIPTLVSGPNIHIDAKGLHPRNEPPFCNAHDRDIGIIRAIAHPSFKGER